MSSIPPVVGIRLDCITGIQIAGILAARGVPAQHHHIPGEYFRGPYRALNSSINNVFLMVDHESSDTQRGRNRCTHERIDGLHAHPIDGKLLGLQICGSRSVNDLFEGAGRQEASLLAKAMGGNEEKVVYH